VAASLALSASMRLQKTLSQNYLQHQKQTQRRYHGQVYQGG